MESIALLVIGILISVIGIVNMTGNISTIHSYHRKKIREEDVPKYGKVVGTGTLVIGLGILADFVLVLLNRMILVPFILIPTLVMGLILILYAQFKYNKGIF